MNELRIGIDLGGTKTEAVVVRVPPPSRLDDRVRAGASAASAGTRGAKTRGDATAVPSITAPDVVARRRIPTARDLGYRHIVEATRDLVFDIAREAGASTSGAGLPPIGVGMPGASTMRRADGTRSSEPLVKNSNTTCLNGMPFHADLERAIGRTICFANDANCFALAETTWGAAHGARVAFGVILGTGVGGGVVLRGESGAARAWDGVQSIAGEWGHVTLDPIHGPPCYCGKRGCVETYLCGPAIERAYRERGGEATGLAEIAARAANGEDLARTLMSERFEIFGRAIAMVINILDPDVVVLGGGMSNIAALYDDGVRAAARWVFNDELTTRIVKNTLGDSAGVLGAALLEATPRDAAGL